MVTGNTARVDTLTLNKILAKRVEPIFTQSVLMAMLRSKGRIMYNQAEDAIRWRPRFKRHQLQPGSLNTKNRDFANINFNRKAELPIRSYDMGSSYSRFERLLSRKKGVLLYNIVDEVTRAMGDDFVESFRLELYKDGNAGDQDTIHGLESWFSQSGLSGNGITGLPNDTYAGLLTTLGWYGGSWPTGTWPLQGTSTTPQYWAWSPLIVDYHSRQFNKDGTSVYNFANKWQQAINFGKTYLKVVQDTTPDICILEPELQRAAEDSLEGIQTFEVTQTSDLVKLGFKTLQYNGLELATEFGVPASVGYILSMKKLALRCALPQLIGAEEDHDIRTSEDLRAISFWGNVMCDSPAFHAKLVAISASGT